MGEAVARPVVLAVIEGLGVRDEREGNAFAQAATPELDALRERGGHTTLVAHGTAVGLPDGQVGDGEAGHLTLGAGRAVQSERSRIDDAIAARQLARNKIIDQTARICLYDECELHLFAPLAESGTHASLDHLFALIDLADFNEIPVVIHAILDGRERGSRGAMALIDMVLGYIEDKQATIGTLSGRFWAMDRDERWDRTYKAFHAVVRDEVLGPAAPREATAFDAMSASYGRGIDDEMVEPVRIGDYSGLRGDFLCDFASTTPVWEWTGEPVGLALSYRADRMRQLGAMLTRSSQLPREVLDDLLMDRDKPVRGFRPHCYATLTDHGADVEAAVAFERVTVADTVGEVVAKAGKRQLRCAETDNRLHATTTFSGRRVASFEGEEHLLVRSPRLVDHYREKPAMNAAKLGKKVAEAVRAGEHELIVVSFPGPDVLAHSGDLALAKAALEAVDGALGEIAAAVAEQQGALLVTSSHGNCEAMVGAKGKPRAGHSDNPVPFIYVDGDDEIALRDDGTLGDVAPTLLELLGIEPPTSMAGRSLRAGTARAGTFRK
jgi:2,3-bisphosphoglycerate-independent phosphoglycerate mutase